MPQPNARDKGLPISSQNIRQLEYPNTSSQYHSKRHKLNGEDMNDYDQSARPASSSESVKGQSSPSSYPDSRWPNAAGQTTEKDIMHKNAHEEKNAPALYGVPLPAPYPPKTWPGYQSSHHPQMYPSDYSRSPQMPYHSEHHHDNAPFGNIQQANSTWKSRKRPPPEVTTTPSQPQPEYQDASLVNYGQYSDQLARYKEPYVNQARYQRGTPVSHAYSSSAVTKLPLDTAQSEPITWADSAVSYSGNHAAYHNNLLPPHHLPNPSNFMNGSPIARHSGPFPAVPPTYGSHNYHGTGLGPPPRHLGYGMMSSQEASFHQQYQFSQPPRSILTLAMEEDENWLSEFLCFVRQYCTEVVCASEKDVISRMNSKKVVLGQVGIRCQFCAHLSHKQRGGRSSTFPSSLSRIYQSLTMMIRDHFVSCPGMPSDIKAKYKDLKGNTSQGVDGSKQYWVDSAKKLGLIDTEDGIFFKDRRHMVSTQSQWNENETLK